MTTDPIKVLYVEDRLEIQTLAQVSLEKIGGFNLCICSSGKEVLDKVVDFDPNIILLDVIMPEMDGIETYQKIRQIPQCAAVPIVFMTARVQEHEIKEYKKIGAVDVITKPFNPVGLADQVKAILSKAMNYEQELKELCQAYGAALPEKISVIQAEWDRLKHHDDKLSNELILKVHSLVGAGTTFGFSSISAAAKELELALCKYQELDFKPSQYTDSLEPFFKALDDALNQPSIDIT